MCSKDLVLVELLLKVVGVLEVEVNLCHTNLLDSQLNRVDKLFQMNGNMPNLQAQLSTLLLVLILPQKQRLLLFQVILVVLAQLLIK